jgi:hypothetical protein
MMLDKRKKSLLRTIPYTHDFINKTDYSRLPIICVRVIQLVDYFSMSFFFTQTLTHMKYDFVTVHTLCCLQGSGAGRMLANIQEDMVKQ